MNKIKIGFIIIFTLILIIPFVNKAFHIDDWVTINFSKLIIEHPPLPYQQTVGYLGKIVPVYKAGHPPLIYFLHSLAMLIFGSMNEITSHLMFAIFPITAAISMFFLAKRFTHYPFYSTLLLISTPIFLVMAHNIMTDIPTLALFLSAMVTYVYGVDKDNKRLLFISSILISLVWLTSYEALILIPLLFIYGILNKKSLGKILFPLLLPILLFCFWSLYNLISFGKLHIIEAINPPYNSLPSQLGKWMILKSLMILWSTIYYITVIGGVTVFPISIFFIINSNFKNKKGGTHLLLFIIFLIYLCLILSCDMNYSFLLNIQFVIFFSAGMLICHMILSRWLRQIFANSKEQPPSLNGGKLYPEFDKMFLSIWFFISLILIILLLPIGAARYILIILPLIIIFFINALEERFFANKMLLKKVYIYSIILTLINGIAVATADYDLADTYRKFSKVVKNYKTARNKIWFMGELGFRFYLEKEGCEYLLTDDFSPREGDIIVNSNESTSIPINPTLKKHLILIKKVNYKNKLPIRVMNRKAHAAFYNSGFGLLAFSLSSVELEQFNIYKIK